MTVTMFAAIEIGSFALEMKIYEIHPKGNIKQIDRIFHVIELGRESYNNKKISFEVVDELCEVLSDFKRIMKEYDVKEYRACATSAVREAVNCQNIIDRIMIRTGINVETLSNSEIRFVYNKSVAMKEKQFNQFIKDGTMIVDVGSGSVQLTVYDKGKLVTTQNIRLGSLRVREIMLRLNVGVNDYLNTLSEFLDYDLISIARLFFKNIDVKNIIATGDYTTYLFDEEYIMKKDMITPEDFLSNYEKLVKDVMVSTDEYVGGTKIPTDLLIPSAMIYKKLLELTGAVKIWVPGVKLCDGMVVEYAERKRKLKVNRNFNDDIISAAWEIAQRYQSNIAHVQLVVNNCLKVFDEIKKYHGLSDRERLLLHIAAILHDCGKYVSTLEPGDSCYNIIAGTEIIGLSHIERMMVANIAKYNTDDFDYEDVLLQEMDKDSYLTITKLTAILRICNALDRTHKQKFKKLSVAITGKEMILSTETFDNIVIERGLFEDKALLFEDIYGIKPVLKVKRGVL